MRHETSIDTDLDIENGQLIEKLFYFVISFGKSSFYSILVQITSFQSHSIQVHREK